MCWNWQVSLTAWGIGLGSAIYLFHRNNKNDIVFGSLILAYSSMQLWEAFMWWSQNCGKLNKIATYAAYFALWSHVLAIGIGLYIEQKVALPLVIGVGFMIYAIVDAFFIHWKCSKPTMNSCKHLKWGFPTKFYSIVFIVCMATALVYVRPLWKAFVVLGLFISTFVMSAIYNKDGTGSLWCWIAATFSFAFIFINVK